MKIKRVSPSRHEIEKARLLYDAGVTPIAEILKLLGMSAGQFRRFRQAQSWPMRASPCTPKEKPNTVAKEKPPLRSLIARLEDAVEREFRNAEAALSRRPSKSIETSARTLASLVRTLAELRRMRRDMEDSTMRNENDRVDGEAGSEAPPRELAELRTELARRLDRLRGNGPAP